MMLLVILLVYFLILFVTLVICIRLTKVFIRRLIGSKHRAAEMVLNTRKAPTDWTRKFESRLEGVGRTRKKERIREKGKRKCIANLEGLIRYFETTRLVENEASREHVVSELRGIRDEWQAKSLEGIAG